MNGDRAESERLRRHSPGTRHLAVSLFRLPILALATSTSLVAAQGQGVRELVLEANGSPITIGSQVVPIARYVRVVPLPGGGTLVVQSMTPEIVRVDSAMRRLVKIGRKGKGPGEYEMAAFAGVVGDTVWITDLATRRLTMLPKLAGGKAITSPINGWSNGTLGVGSLAALTPDGSAMALAGGDSRLMASGLVQRVPLLRLTRDGAKVLDTLATLDVRHAAHVVAGPSGMTIEQMFSDQSLWAASGSGSAFAVVHQPDGDFQARSISVYTRAGKIRYAVALPFPVVSFSVNLARQIVEARFREASAIYGSSTAVPDRENFMRSLFVPRNRVPISDIVVGDDGAVLLRGNDWTGTLVEYVALRSDGTVRGRLRVPREQWIRAFTGDQVWSVRPNDAGEFRLVRQRIASRTP